MFKLLEKSPFVRWKFVQRLVHRHRMSKRTGSSKFKTFSRAQAATADTQDIMASNESISDSHTMPQTSSNMESPFNIKSRVDKANESIGIVTQSNGYTRVDVEDSPKVTRRCYSDTSLAKIVDDSEEEIDTTEKGASNIDPASTAEIEETDDHNIEHCLTSQQKDLPTFNRTSRLRASLKEFKKRSKSHIENARESMRRRAAPPKYGNLDVMSNNNDEDEEIVSYESSPGLKRRQVIQL